MSQFTKPKHYLPLTEGPFSKLEVRNLTGETISFHHGSIPPESEGHPHKLKLSTVQKIVKQDFEIIFERITYSPLPEQVKGTILLLSREVAIHYPQRKDIFYAVPDTSDLYPSGAPRYHTGIARVVDNSEIQAFEPQDGF